MFVSKNYAECALKISTFTKALGTMHIRTFFSPDCLILRPGNVIQILFYSKYSVPLEQIYISLNNILLNTIYQMLQEKIQNILGDQFMCKLFCHTSNSHTRTDDLQSICSVSILHHIHFNEDQKHILFMSHTPTCIVAGQYIIRDLGQGLIWKIRRTNSQLSSKSEKFTVTSFP